MHPIDLRSDTVTKPTEAMREAMARAEVGDDVYGEDPTVNRMEAMVAEMLGKEAAVYVPSGTMGNLVSVLSHCNRGDEMILGDQNHIFLYEQGGAAAVGGIQPRTVRNLPDGTQSLEEMEAAIRGDNEHYPITALIAVENTHNRCGGRALPVAYMDAVGALAHAHNLKFHVDGARLWNAAVALGESPARVLQAADSASVCLSKGLGAPIGSVVVGDAAFIRRARRMRKQVGGGMRQAGVMAAAGIVALTTMFDRLAEDHANAKLLANGLQRLEGVDLDPATVETNLVYFKVTRPELTAAELVGALKERGVLVGAVGAQSVRAVINHHVTSADVETVLDVFADALAADEPRVAARSAYG